MDASIATQLITVGATLAGVLLTLAANAHLERRRSRDTRELESLRLASEHARWLRDERVKAYAAFALACEDTLQFIRSEMPKLIGSKNTDGRDIIEGRWGELRTELRKAYNQVALFGADDAQALASTAWRSARNGGNDFLRDLERGAASDASAVAPSQTLRDLASSLGALGEQFLRTCRDELRTDKGVTPVA
jgi:hypothetical protein